MNWGTRNGHRGPVRQWLGAPGSLSARLVGAGQNFSVQVLNQGMQPMRWDEAKALGLHEIKAG